MTSRQETFFKWALYAAATAACMLVQGFILQNLEFRGVFPFVYPILAATVASLEGPLNGTVYSLVLGVICDLILVGPIPCFYTLILPPVGLYSAFLARGVLSSGWLGAMAASVTAFLFTGLFHALILAMKGKAAWSASALVCGKELAVSILLVIPVYALFRAVYRKSHAND